MVGLVLVACHNDGGESPSVLASRVDGWGDGPTPGGKRKSRPPRTGQRLCPVLRSSLRKYEGRTMQQ